MEPVPVKYQLGDVFISYETEFISAIGNKPGYWYIHKPLRVWDKHPVYSSEMIRGFFRDKLNSWYWNGEQWDYCKPKQFPTVEAAVKEYRALVV